MAVGLESLAANVSRIFPLVRLDEPGKRALVKILLVKRTRKSGKAHMLSVGFLEESAWKLEKKNPLPLYAAFLADETQNFINLSL